MYNRLRLFIVGLLLSVFAYAQAQTLSEHARVSLITCTPGEELYARYGHTALRVYDEANGMDITFNYGIFDFNTEHFYWKFVRGETWYELGVAPTWWFMQEYTETQRPVYEQELNLSPEQRESLWEALETNYLPQNRYYLYNFVFDNCATRPYILLKQVFGDTILSDYTGYTGITYRQFIRHYTGALSWENAGINLLFGPRADQPMTNEQRLFLPEELMRFIQEARLSDGTPVVSESRIGAFQAPRTPWYASWPLGLALYFVLVCLISWRDRKRQRGSWWLEATVGTIYLLLIILVTFLTFFSCHPLVGFGWRLLIIPLTHLCARLIYIVR